MPLKVLGEAEKSYGQSSTSEYQLVTQYVCIHVCTCICVYNTNNTNTTINTHNTKLVRPISLLTLWISEGLTRARS